MQRVRYTGPIPRLQGLTALSYPPAGDVRRVQFDSTDVPEGYGWHDLPAVHFQLVPELETTHG